jgi:glycosyltransferase involved in cell wall biosynthesis
VLYERKSAKNRNLSWLSKRGNNFEEIFLKGRAVGVDSSLSIGILSRIKDSSYDLVIIGGYSTPTGMLAIKYLNLIKRPFILNIDGGLIKKDNFFKYWLKKHFISSASYWLSPSTSATDYLLYYGASATRVYEYPFTSIREQDISDSLSAEKKQDARRIIGFKGHKMVLTVGQMIHRKGIDIVLDVASRMKDVTFYIIGGEPTLEYLEMKENLKLSNVHFEGFKSKEVLSDYYTAADLFLLPTREDIWGLVINEAMAFGLPVITTDQCVSGLELIEPGENGFIVPINDVQRTLNATRTILDNDSLRKSMEYESLKTIKKYTIEQMATKHFKAFEAILNENAIIKDNMGY